MKRTLHFLLVLTMLAISSHVSAAVSGCSVAGTPATSNDSICVNGSSTLTLTGYTGAIQWQSFNGLIWVDETGTGATADTFVVSPANTTDYRAVVTFTGCAADISATLTITVGVTPPSTTGDTRCGYGSVTLTASGGGNFKWYDTSTGGNLLGTGSSFSTIVSSTTTFYAAATSNGGGSGITQMPPENTTLSGGLSRGYWFTAPSDFTMTGLSIPGVTGSQNLAVLQFVPATAPPAYPTVTNSFNLLFLTQNNPSTGVIPVNINVAAGDVIGLLATSGTTDINSYAPSPATVTIDGQLVTITRMGMQSGLSVTSPIDIWTEVGGSISRVDITYEVGCESGRTPTVATVTTSDSISINASATALCQGQSATLTASSNNSSYNYTWSPATGLSGTSGSTVTATPTSPITYTVVADDGTCGAIDSVTINVGPASVLGTATISTDTICSGSNAILSITGYTGSIQWQSFNGTTWVNETGIGNDMAQYTVSPGANTLYQVVVTSGGCPSVTSTTLNLDVLTITDPISVDDTICGPGTVNLQANGQGIINWFAAATGGSSINTGANYSPSIVNTTTFYAEASAGGTYFVGPPNSGIGSQILLAGLDWGLQFDVTQQVTIEKVFVSPGAQSGPITINLRDALGGPVINTVTTNVTSFSGLTAIDLGFTVNPGTGYRLELATGSVQCYYNSFGAVYPYTVSGSALTITGSINPNFDPLSNFYYFFYNWIVTEGCKSNRVPVTGVVLTPPAVPVISALGNTLTSSATSGNQWYLNGTLIPGANGQVYIATQPGSYTVTVTDATNGCEVTSAPEILTGLSEDPALGGITLYPNPVNDLLMVSFKQLKNPVEINIYNVLGEKIKTNLLKHVTNEIKMDMAPGNYTIELITEDHIYKSKIIKL